MTAGSNRFAYEDLVKDEKIIPITVSSATVTHTAAFISPVKIMDQIVEDDAGQAGDAHNDIDTTTSPLQVRKHSVGVTIHLGHKAGSAAALHKPHSPMTATPLDKASLDSPDAVREPPRTSSFQNNAPEREDPSKPFPHCYKYSIRNNHLNRSTMNFGTKKSTILSTNVTPDNSPFIGGPLTSQYLPGLDGSPMPAKPSPYQTTAANFAKSEFVIVRNPASTRITIKDLAHKG
jgi:hypothetical protein